MARILSGLPAAQNYDFEIPLEGELVDIYTVVPSDIDDIDPVIVGNDPEIDQDEDTKYEFVNKHNFSRLEYNDLLYNHENQENVKNSSINIFGYLMKLFFGTILVLTHMDLGAQITTWNGSSSSVWSVAANWSSGVPDQTYDVVIPPVSNQPIINSGVSALAKSITVNQNATLTNEGTLTIEGSTSDALTVAGSFVNASNSTLVIGAATNRGINISSAGDFENNGVVEKNSLKTIGGNFIENTGTFTNKNLIEIEGTAAIPIRNRAAGDFTNDGQLNIGLNSSTNFTGNYGIQNEGTFAVDSSGEINIIYGTGSAMIYNASGTLENYGTINLGQDAAAYVDVVGIRNEAAFENYDTINIDNVQQHAIRCLRGKFKSSLPTSSINIGQNYDGGIGASGINVLGESTFFENSGIIKIDLVTDYGIELIGSGTVILNNGTIEIGLNSTGNNFTGIIVNGDFDSNTGFRNDGTLEIRNYSTGILVEAIPADFIESVFYNTGDLYLANGSVAAITEIGIFENAGLIGGEAKNIDVNSAIGGTISPGFSPGTISFSGSPRFDSGAKFVMEVDHNSAGGYDSIAVAGTLDLSNIDLEVVVNYGPQLGDAIEFITANTITGSFNSTSLPLGWQVVIGSNVVSIRRNFDVITTWTGNTSNDWFDIDNWTSGVPNFSSTVVIPDVDPKPQPIIGTDSSTSANRILIHENATLNNQGTLIIDGSNSDALTLDGIFFNGGSNSKLMINTATNHAINVSSSGYFENNGMVESSVLSSIGGNFIHNGGEFINRNLIEIEGTAAKPVLNDSTGVFTNDGQLSIGLNSATNFTEWYGIRNDGEFTVGSDGVINMIYGVKFGMIGNFSGEGQGFSNYGTINIGQDNSANLNIVGIANARGTFRNYDTINIDNLTSQAITVSWNGIFENSLNGVINIGQNYDNTLMGVAAIEVRQGDLFLNYNSINIDRVGAIAIRVEEGVLENKGDIEIGLNSTGNNFTGIYLEGPPGTGRFTNDTVGTIRINNYNKGIIAGVDFPEDDYNGGLFRNEGELYFSDGIDSAIVEVISFTITNTGLIGGEASDIYMITPIEGTISPGFSPGTISFAGSPSFASGARFVIEVDGTAVGDYDSISVTGAIDLSNIELEVAVNYTPSHDDRIVFLTASTISGTFSGVASALPDGWTIDYSVSGEVALVYREFILAISALLQGPYDEVTGLMTDSLRSGNYLPMVSPYGDGLSVEDPSVFNQGGSSGAGSASDDIVDWVWLEFRSEDDNGNPTVVEFGRSALIQRDGNIVDMDGISNVVVKTLGVGTYYVVVQHRNHLGVMTATATIGGSN